VSESDRARRRREQAEDDAERAALERGDIGRPNEPWRPSATYIDCPGSKFGTHRFAGPRRVCEFCLKPEADCRREAPRG